MTRKKLTLHWRHKGVGQEEDPVIKKIMEFFNRRKDEWWWKVFKFIFEKLLLPIGVPIMVTLVTINYVNKPFLPEVETTLAYNSGQFKWYVGAFKVDMKPDTLAWDSNH